MRRLFVFPIILSLLISGCQQHVDSKEIDSFMASVSDRIEKSTFDVNFAILNKLPNSLTLSEELSDLGIYLDGSNVGSYEVSSGKLSPGNNVINVSIKVDQEKIHGWLKSFREKAAIALRADLVFEFGDYLLKIMHQRSGVMIIPLQPSINSTSMEIDDNYTTIIHSLEKPFEIETCRYLVNGLNVTEDCFAENLTLVHRINNTKLSKALSENLFEASFSYYVRLNVGGKKLELESEREATFVEEV